MRAFAAAGAAGILLEDQVEPKRCGHFAGKQVVPPETMLDRLAAALDARPDPDFVIIARTDARAVEGLDAAIDRACRYAAAGADMAFVEAPVSVAELERIARSIPVPQLANMLPGGQTPIVPLPELERMGFKMAVDPTATLAACGFAVRELAARWLEDGDRGDLDARMLSFAELKDLLGVAEAGGPANSPSVAQPEGDEPWMAPAGVAHARILLDSFARLLGRELIPRGGGPAAEAARLFAAPLVVVSHGTEADPVLNYGNARALDLWEMSWDEFTRTPSRLTAEPVHRDERALLLERTRRQGFVDDYAGIRISGRGNRFRIEQAIVWNLAAESGRPVGQAATFDRWVPLPEAGG